MHKIRENAISKCDRCECLIVSDSSDPENDICIHPGSKEYERYNKNFPKSESSIDSVFTEKCQTPVKITVQTKCVPNDDTTTSTQSDTTYSRRLQTDFSMKNICFKLCPKKKTVQADDKKSPPDDKRNDRDLLVEETKNDLEDTAEVVDNKITTSPAKDNKITTSPTKDSKNTNDEEHSVEELMKKYGLACKPLGDGSCNTNAIIFPKMPGDNFTKMEDFLRTEIRNGDRKMEEILNELYRQRRELREVKELLELLARIVKDQVFIKNGKNGLYELCMDLCKNNSLERKSNSLSLSKTANSPLSTPPTEVAKTAAPLQSPRPNEEEKKKKCRNFFWCL